MFRVDFKDGWYLTGLMVFALISVTTTTGTIYGWANIVMVFRTEGLYLHLCPWLATNNTQQQQQQAINATSPENHVPFCPAQDQMFNLIFTISVNCFAITMLPGGILIDKRGPHTASIVSGVMYLVGALCLSFATTSEGYHLLFPAFILLGLGGKSRYPCVHIATTFCYFFSPFVLFIFIIY